MTITTDNARASETGPAATMRGFVIGGALGAVIAGLIVGLVIGNAVLWGVAGGVVVLVLLMVITGMWLQQGASPPKAERVRALAMIEGRRATGDESGDVPIKFDLTVAPDERPAYRVEFTQSINLVDIPDYPVRGIVVVEYPADQPWSVSIVTQPDPEWARRAAEASIDSVPATAVVKDPNHWGSYCLIMLVGLLLGAAVIIVLFRADLFQSNDSESKSGSPQTSSSGSTGRTGTSGGVSSSSTVATTSASLLEPGLMRATADSMIKAAGTPDVVSFSIKDHRMSAQGVTSGQKPAKPPVDLRSVPYERLPGLVGQARGGLGLKNPGSWHIDISHDGRSGGGLLIRVTVSDGHGSAWLEADGQGRVTARHPG